MICDWCGKNNSKNSDSKEVFHVLAGYAFNPVICDDCFSELKKTKSFAWKHKNSRTIKPTVYSPSVQESDKAQSLPQETKKEKGRRLKSKI